jgi:hypothetical protein
MDVVGDPYVDLEVFKASVSMPDNATDADCTMALLAASRAVEQCTRRRTFWKDSGSTARAYTAHTCTLVTVDDTTTVTAVTVDGSALAVGDFLAEPANAVVDQKPFLRVRSPSGLLTGTRAGVVVTGTFGWPAVPAEVPQLVTIIASKLLKRTREAPWGVITAGGLDGSAVRLAQTDPDARLLVNGLTRALVY